MSDTPRPKPSAPRPPRLGSSAEFVPASARTEKLPASADPQVGDRLGKYLIRGRLGEGGMGWCSWRRTR
jgi:hypothetical protein